MEAFARARAPGARSEYAHQLVGEAAFNAWRRLPRRFHPGFERRMLAVWRSAPRGPLEALGGRWFQAMARIVGPLAAARLMRSCRNAPYARIRTLSPAELAALLASSP